MPAATDPAAVLGARYRIPSLGRRLLGGALRFVPLLVLWVGVPYYAFRAAGQYGVHSPISLPALGTIGLFVAFLSAASYVLKPTRLYGPVSFVGSLLVIGYLLSIVPSATLTLTVGNGVNVSLGYGTLVLFLLAAPILSALSALVTAAEDAVDPLERLSVDFPP
ncbi:MAG: hypothetical protein L3K09_05330 [Thermoplasmata archaeon]|nr:hypothetical protein [Thermoplasmata archaeon]